VSLAWISRHDLLVAAGDRIVRLSAQPGRAVRRVADATAPGPIEAIAARPGRAGIVAALGRGRLWIVETRAPSQLGETLQPFRTLLDVPAARGPVAILWR
jgi:hypothetical protein